MSFQEKFLINNDKGNFSFIALLTCLVACSIFSITIIKKIQIHYSLKKTLTQYNCIKEYNAITNNHVSFMEKTNWSLKNIDKVNSILFLFPQFQLINLTTKSLKMALKRLQDVELFSYMEKVMRMKNRSCPIPLNAFIPLYNNIQRGKGGIAPLRNKTWNLIFSGEVLIKVKYQVKKQKLQIVTTQYL